MYFSKLLFYASAVFGVRCFDSKGKFSRWQLLYAMVLVSTRFRYYLIAPEKYESSHSVPFLQVMNILTKIGHLGIIVSHIYQSIRHREVFERVFEVILRNYKIANPKIETAVFVLIACSIAFSAYCRLRMNMDIIPYTLIVAVVSEALIVIQFCSICHSTVQKYDPLTIEHLNKRLNDHRTRVHVLEAANKAYGLQIFFVFIQLTGYIIFLCYRYIMYCWGGSHLCTSSYRYLIQTTMAMKCFLAFYLIVCCEVVKNQVTDFHHDLSKLMRYNPHLYSNKKLSLILTMDETVQFTACGYFRLGYPLVTSIIAAISTYTTVIFQLSQSDDAKCTLQSMCKIQRISKPKRLLWAD